MSNVHPNGFADWIFTASLFFALRGTQKWILFPHLTHFIWHKGPIRGYVPKLTLGTTPGKSIIKKANQKKQIHQITRLQWASHKQHATVARRNKHLLLLSLDASPIHRVSCSILVHKVQPD